MKYVIIKVEERSLSVTRVYPIIFTERLIHSEVAVAMKRSIGWDQPKGHDSPEVMSAGFCELDNGGYFVVTRHGSESIGIKEQPLQSSIDEGILNMPDAMQGIVP